MVLGRFVASDMDMFGGEYIEHFVEDAVHRLQRRIFAGAQDVGENALPGLYGDLFARAGQFGIGRNRRRHVPGHVDFGDHIDVPFGAISDDFTQFAFGIESAVVLSRVYLAEVGTQPYRALFGQQGIAFNRNSPTLVVGQMPVKGIHFKQGGCVDKGFDVAESRDVPGRIEQKAPVGEKRAVPDFHTGHR
ncbi:MAG: hypothetical protein BWY37_00873 [Firmicutes bacterium ADurb.Bin262]|nr:MAG: hypothetical protein BWY37_00873 [Firmicutes bacterium ADurb.Bin262]